MTRDTTRRVPADQARREARIALGKDPDDLSDVYRGRPTRARPIPKPGESMPARYTPPTPLSLADAASQLGIRAVRLAQHVMEGQMGTVHGPRGELLIPHEEVERLRALGPGGPPQEGCGT